MYNRGRNVSQGGLTNYLMPFLILICIGVIVVLAFHLYQLLTNKQSPKAAYMHFVEGNAEMKTWGTEDFLSLFSDALIMQGDEVITSADAKVIVEFFDGTIMRLNGKTDVNFVEISDKSSPPKITISLLDGKAWFNKLYRNTGNTIISVKTANLEIVSKTGSIFEIENGADQAVRVFSGSDSSLLVNIYDKNGEKIIESENIGVGQEIVFSKAVLERYWQHQSPSVLNAVSDEFKLTPWYAWNAAEDKAPTAFEKSVNGNIFVKVNPEKIGGENLPVESSDEESVGTESELNSKTVGEPLTGASSKASDGASSDTSSSKITELTKKPEEKPITLSVSTLSKPAITSVGGVKTTDEKGFYVVKKSPATITGTVGAGTEKVEVNGFVLKKFMPGDSVWNYFANADYGFMKIGENTYQIYAIDANGNKSQPLTIKVLYQPEEPPASDNGGINKGSLSP